MYTLYLARVKWSSTRLPFSSASVVSRLKLSLHSKVAGSSLMELERSSSCTVASSSSWTASAWEQRRERNPPTCKDIQRQLWNPENNGNRGHLSSSYGIVNLCNQTQEFSEALFFIFFSAFSESSQRSCQKITIFDPHLRSINAKLGSDPLGLTSTFKDEEVDAPHRKRTCLIPGM